MNQDSNTNQIADPLGSAQATRSDAIDEISDAKQFSSEINASQNVGVTTSSPELQIDNREIPNQSGGRKKYLKIIMIFVAFFLALMVVAYLAYNLFIKGKYPTQDNSQIPSNSQDTVEENYEIINSSWSTYLNTVYGYTIKFPESWTTKVVSDGESSEATINTKTFDIYDPESTQTYPVGVATLQILEQEPFYDESWQASQVTINSVPMSRYISMINDKMTSQTYLVDLGSENYLEIVFRYEDGDGNKEVFDEMINSFNLLASPQSDVYTQTDKTDTPSEDDYEGDFGDL